MAELDEAELAVQRLESALDRIGQVTVKAAPVPLDTRVAVKLDNLIRALRTALDS